MEKGYAAVLDQHILIDTVSTSDRAAMISWLIVHAGFMVPHGMGDFAIRDNFARYSKGRGVSIKPVRIQLEEGN